jgi:glucosyl-dolichyl phosphate glucuronosyltransferase
MPMTYSIVIATHNRAADLRGTLGSLATLRAADPWEVIVVDNNSTDGTAAVVSDLARSFPVPLRYRFEPVPGRSAALNHGIAAAQGEIIHTTDDDVRVEPDWLEQARDALEDLQCGYIGGRVLPIWGGRRPSWLPDHPSHHWAVIALLDYGAEPFELTSRMPLGVNMAFRRHVFDTVGGWNPNIGRKAGTLLGQEVREWCVRARAKGVRGYYAPAVTVRHIIPPERLDKQYFRRFFYWRGISRALLYQQRGLDMESPQTTHLDFRCVPHLFGVPRYMFRSLLAAAGKALASYARGAEAQAFEKELYVWMFAGIARQRWRDRRRPFEWEDLSHSADAPASRAASSDVRNQRTPAQVES